MAKTAIKQRRRTPSKKSTKATVKKHQKLRKRNAKRNARKELRVDDLADQLAGQSVSASPASFAKAARPGPGSKLKPVRVIRTKKGRRAKKDLPDDEMEDAPKACSKIQKTPVAREELKKKLRARLANQSLDRTTGLQKGVIDSSGLKLKKKRPKAKGAMEVS